MTVEQLEDRLSEPTRATVDALARLPGDIIILGAGGKMGPTLARMAQRASTAANQSRRVIAVSRFSQPQLQDQFQRFGIETLRCDLLHEEALTALPRVPNVVLMTGLKFGSSAQNAMTWAMNTYLPALVCRHFRASKMVVFSTGNVYPFMPVDSTGPEETHPLNPVGEYGMTAVGRERICEHFSRAAGTLMSIVRLNYACELRYGVLVDVAQRVWAGQPVPLAMGFFNVIWQGDANNLTWQCFNHVATPPYVVNVAGREALSVRKVAAQFGQLFGKTPIFEGTEQPTALLSNSQKAEQTFGPPLVGTPQLIAWIADWLQKGGPTLNKPTHFETRDGAF